MSQTPTMQAVVVLDDCIAAQGDLLDLARQAVTVLDAGDHRTELLRLPYNPAGNRAEQLFALALVSMRAYRAVFVVQPEGRALAARALWRIARDGSGALVARLLEEDGIEAHSDTDVALADLATPKNLATPKDLATPKETT